VSANRYWGKRAYIDRETHKPMAIVYVTDEAKSYKSQCAWIAKVAGFKQPTERPVEITSITLCPRMNKDGSASGTVLDLGNCWKVLEDALQGVVYVNDRQIKRIRNVEYGEPTAHGAIEIEIEEFVPAPAPLFAHAAAA
jgi:crossover junction endodeoxyribonuclease RusA